MSMIIVCDTAFACAMLLLSVVSHIHHFCTASFGIMPPKRRADSVPVSIACKCLCFFFLDANLSNCDITHLSLFIYMCVQACLANVVPTFAFDKIQICTMGIVKISFAKGRTLRHNIKPSSPSLGLCSCLCSSCICSNCSIDQDNAYVV